MSKLRKEIIKLQNKASKALEIGRNAVDVAHNIQFSDYGNNTSEHVLDHKEALRMMKIVTDTDTFARLVWDEYFNIIYANELFLDKFGYELEEVVGNPLFNEDGLSQFMTDESAKEAKGFIQKNLENGVKWVVGVVNQWKKKNGEIVTIEWQLGFNDDKTGIGSAQCIFDVKK